MSYKTMFRHETECDFPGCNQDFDSTNGARCAIWRDRVTRAFCSKHAAELKNEGVNLKTVSQVRDEREAEKTPPPTRELTEDEHTTAFIDSLK